MGIPRSYEKALTLIAADAVPCRTCEEPHKYRKEGSRWTWADQDDGHRYNKIPVQEFALMVLEGRRTKA